MNAPLRVGVVVEPRPWLAWESELLHRVAASPACVVVAIRRASAPPAAAAPGGPFARAARAILRRLDAKVARDDPCALAPAGDDPLEGVPVLDLHDGATAADVERLAALHLDVIVDLASDAAPAALAACARHGTWVLRQRGRRARRGGLDGGWGRRETLDGEPATELRLVREDGDAPRTIACARFATTRCSARKTLRDACWKGALLVPAALRRLHETGRVDDPVPDPPGRPPCPGDAAPVALAWRQWRRLYAARLRGLVLAPQWLLLSAATDAVPPRLATFRRHVPPPDRIWADPHVAVHDGRRYVFFEEMRRGDHGRIACFEMDADGRPGVPRIVLERPWHLSYPGVVAHRGRWYMVPESSQRGTVDLYRAAAFPDRWEHVQTLLDGLHAVDPTLHFHDGRWYLFACVRGRDRGSTDDELCLYWSESLEGGRWRAHPRNPVVADVTRARPAGPLFVHEERLYRPAQDCSVRYGYGIRLQEVVALSPDAYAEREAAFLPPGWARGIVATHTLSRGGGLCVADALHERFAPAWRR